MKNKEDREALEVVDNGWNPAPFKDDVFASMAPLELHKLDLGYLVHNTTTDLQATYESIPSTTDAMEDTDPDGECDLFEETDRYEDFMDGDHDSALASCGWGMDEDY